MPSLEAKQFVMDSIKMRPWFGPIIDLGAGQYSSWYRGLFENVKYTTLDIKQTKKEEIDIIADITYMPQIQSAAYGVVLLLETLEHTKNPFKAFKEIARILKKDGLFICTTVACYSIHEHPKDYWRFLPDGLAVLCEHAKLKIYHQELTSKDTTKQSFCRIAAYK